MNPKTATIEQLRAHAAHCHGVDYTQSGIQPCDLCDELKVRSPEPLHKVLPAGEPLQRAPFKPCEACPSATACERWGYCNAEAARGEA